MNTIQKLTAIALCGLFFVSIGCSKKDDGPTGCNWALEVQAETEALSNAINTYASDPTTANCQAYINAYQNYLNALEDNLNCAGLNGTQAELQAAINQAQAELNNIGC